MESQPQNLEFRINPENLHPCKWASTLDLATYLITKQSLHTLRTLTSAFAMVNLVLVRTLK